MPPLTGSDSKADDGETSAASLEDLLPMPELSLPESPPPSVAATPAGSQSSAPTQGQTPPSARHQCPARHPLPPPWLGRPLPRRRQPFRRRHCLRWVRAMPLRNLARHLPRKRSRGHRESQNLSLISRRQGGARCPLTTSAPKKTRAAAKTIVTAEGRLSSKSPRPAPARRRRRPRMTHERRN